MAPGTDPALTASNCPALLSSTLIAPTILGADMQAASDVLAAVDSSHAYAEFAKLPATFTYWMRVGGSAVDLVSLGTATHETNHEVDRALRNLCNTDGRYRYFVAGTVYTTDLLTSSTTNYSIVSETYPAALAVSRATRYGVYITGSASASGNTFGVLLDELTAYSGSADLERRILATPSLAYLVRSGDFNAGGMTDFMSYLQFYLTSARLNHGQSYAVIQSSTATVAYLQVAWTRAERILGELYPYSTAAVGPTGQTVPIDVLRAIYSADALHELDALGITHRTAADYATTYLR